MLLQITDESLYSLANLEHLKHLEVRSCSRIGDSGVKELCFSRDTLVTLDVSESLVTTDCLKLMVQHVKNSPARPDLTVVYNGIRILARNVVNLDDLDFLDEHDLVDYGDNYDFDDKGDDEKSEMDDELLENDDPAMAAEKDLIS